MYGKIRTVMWACAVGFTGLFLAVFMSFCFEGFVTSMLPGIQQ